MKIRLGGIDADGLRRHLEAPDGSRVGINYADAFLKKLKVTLEDGRKVSCRRRGLKLTLTVGDRTGEGLLRRIEHGPDPRKILEEALKEAARNAGAVYLEEDGSAFLELTES